MRSRIVIAAILISVTGIAVAGIQQMLLAAKNPSTATATLPSSINCQGIGAAGSTFASITLASNGQLVVDCATSGSVTTPWILTGNQVDFEAKLSGAGDPMDPFQDAIDTWLSAFPRHWGYFVPDFGTNNPSTFTGTLSIRRISDGTVLATSAVTLYSQCTSGC